MPAIRAAAWMACGARAVVWRPEVQGRVSRLVLAMWLMAPLAVMPAWASDSAGSTGSTGSTGGSGAGLQIERILHEALDVERLSASVALRGGRLTVSATADRLLLPEPLGTLSGVRLECPSLVPTTAGWRCREARLSADGGDLALADHPLRLDWNTRRNRVRIAGPWPDWFGAEGEFVARVAGADDWRVELTLQGLDPVALAESPRLAAWLPEEPPVVLQGGRADLELEGDARGGHRARLALHDLAFSDVVGLRAGEGIDGHLQAREDDGAWALEGRLETGAVFVDPWFVDLAETGALQVDLEELRPGADPLTDGLDLAALRGSLGDMLEFSGEQVRIGSLESPAPSGIFRATAEDPGAVHAVLLDPVLAGTLGRDLTVSGGSVSGRLELAGGEPRAAGLRWSGLGAEDGAGRFGVAGSDGELDWLADAPGRPGQVSWERAHLFRLPLGEFEARVRAQPDGIDLLQETRIPIIDGALRADDFGLRLTADGPDVRFTGGVQAVSLEPLTEILDWPRFSGRLAGMIPEVRLDRGDLAVDGRLLVQVFDGDVVLRDVRVRDLFGRTPELGLSARMDRLDLELVTRAFEVGRVEGRLSGRLDDLHMIDWRPVRMDLALRTPEDDPGRRRISQRAVQNITELGGPVQAAASSVFLRFFENFSYRRLGFRCQLRGGVCELDGVGERADGGFTLVQGGGLPRIEVIGYNRRVDWDELLRGLSRVTAGETPEVR
ncbi:hypothetical protein [Thioalkalivibrio sp. ALJ24]|uniref:hypothetical protein n=1 Tax=Thioalkalivibrio sp. ALJ24 TaxID=545276 RepID=UPI00351073AA